MSQTRGNQDDVWAGVEDTGLGYLPERHSQASPVARHQQQVRQRRIRSRRIQQLRRR